MNLQNSIWNVNSYKEVAAITQRILREQPQDAHRYALEAMELAKIYEAEADKINPYEGQEQKEQIKILRGKAMDLRWNAGTIDREAYHLDMSIRRATKLFSQVNESIQHSNTKSGKPSAKKDCVIPQSSDPFFQAAYNSAAELRKYLEHMLTVTDISHVFPYQDLADTSFMPDFAAQEIYDKLIRSALANKSALKNYIAYVDNHIARLQIQEAELAALEAQLNEW